MYRTNSRPRNGWRRDRLVWVAVATVVISGLVVGPLAKAAGSQTPSAMRSGSSPSAFATAGMLDCTAILPDSLINGTVAHANTGTENVTAVDDEIATMFAQVCAEPQFVSLVNEWGAKNFSFGMYGDHLGIVFANFTMLWSNWSAGKEYSNQEWWAGCVITGVITGPFLETGQPGFFVAVQAGACSHPSPGGSSGSGLFGGELPNVVVPIALAASVAVGIIAFASARGRRGK